MPQSLFKELNINNPQRFILEKPSFTSVRKASGQKILIDKQTKGYFQFGSLYFQDVFLILPTMNSVCSWSSSTQKKIISDMIQRKKLLQLQDLTAQFN